MSRLAALIVSGCAAVMLGACQPGTVAPTTVSVPAGSVQVSELQMGYIASVPAVMTPYATRRAGADFDYRSTSDQMFMTLTSGPIDGQTSSGMFAAERERLTRSGVAVQFADLLDDRFVIFGIKPNQDVAVTVTQFGEDCDGTPIFASTTNGFNNDKTPIEYHFTNTHPNYPRFSFGAACG